MGRRRLGPQRRMYSNARGLGYQILFQVVLLLVQSRACIAVIAPISQV